MTPASSSLSPRLLPVISLATIITSLLVAVLAARIVDPTLLGIGNIIEFVLGNLLVSGSLGLLASLLALRVMLRPLWLRTLVAMALGFVHGFLWHAAVAFIFEPRLADVLAPLLPVWVLSGVGGLMVGLVLIPAVAQRAPLTGPMIVGCSTTLLVVVALCGFMGMLPLGFLLDNGTTLHVISHPTAPITALVVSDSCGATCRCTVRVDLKTDRHYFRQVYRGRDCDAEVSWQSPVLLHIQDNDGGRLDLDIRSLGLSVP